MSGLTDSQVAMKAVDRNLSTAFPLCCVQMELAAQCEQRGISLDLDWVPRGMNKEADRLADGDSTGFTPELRVGATLSEVPFLVLQDLLRTGLECFSRGSEDALTPAGSGEAPRAAPGVAKRGRRRPLREREPW